MPTPLPSPNDPDVRRMADQDASYLSAYNMCLGYEAELVSFADKLRHVRILGFLLLHAPNRGIRSEVTRCIHSLKGSSELSDFGAFFERSVILPFKRYRGRTPDTSEYPSRPSEDMKEVDITQAPRNHKDAKARALIRDGWRCVVTGILERGTPADVSARFHDPVAVYTLCAHVIPEFTFLSAVPGSEDNRELHFSASILSVLRRLSYDIDKFNGERVHSLTNVMTLQGDICDGFGRLELYFEATSEENRYEIKWYGPKWHDARPFVTFSTPDPVNLPVPAPGLLALHTICSKVAHLSGASEYIDDLYCDADDEGVLSADGASGDLLSHMLSSVSNHVVTQSQRELGVSW